MPKLFYHRVHRLLAAGVYGQGWYGRVGKKGETAGLPPVLVLKKFRGIQLGGVVIIMLYLLLVTLVRQT